MSLEQYIPSYNAAADVLEGKRNSLANLAALTLSRAVLMGIALTIAGLRDSKTIVKASLIASSLSSALLLAAIKSAAEDG